MNKHNKTSNNDNAQIINNTFKFNSRVFFSLISLIKTSFLNNRRGPMFMFIMPIFFMIMFYYIYDQENALLFPYMILPCFTIITSLSPAIVEWKNSVFLKRIDTSGIKKITFLLALWLFYLIMSFIAFITQFIVANFIAWGDLDFKDMLRNINIGYLILGIAFISITCILIASLIGGIANTDGGAQAFSFIIYFTSIFLSGVMIPGSIIEKSVGMRIFTYFIPLKYAVNVFLFAISGGDKLADLYAANIDGKVIYDFTHVWQAILGAFVLGAIFAIITVFTFKWIPSTK